jgi:hypothetical protein
MDVVLQDPQTGLIGGVEVKSSMNAFMRFDQEARQSRITVNNTIKILWPPPVP